MNKLMKILAASALVATTLVGCSGSSAKYAKMGLGVVSSVSDGQVNTTFVAVGLDSDDKIQYIDLDVAQGTPATNELTQTKEDRKEDYDMKKASGIQKEWYEQAAAFEDFCKGKTADEVAAIETEKKDEEHNAVPKAGSDLAAGCTINIGDFKEAVAKACANAQEVEADELKLGRAMSYEADQGKDKNEYLTTDLALIATDSEGKIVKIDIETAKIKNDGSELRTKTEQQGDYNMKGSSGIQKEWYEQVAALETGLVGKSVDDAAKLAGDDGKVSDTDIAAGCTISVTGFQNAIAAAR